MVVVCFRDALEAARVRNNKLTVTTTMMMTTMCLVEPERRRPVRRTLSAAATHLNVNNHPPPSFPIYRPPSTPLSCRLSRPRFKASRPPAANFFSREPAVKKDAAKPPRNMRLSRENTLNDCKCFNRQCSKTLDNMGLMAMPLKSSQDIALVLQSLTLGIGTI